MVIWLSETDVRASLDMPRLVREMAKALANFSAGAVKQPVRSVIEVDGHSFFATMPAYAPGVPAMGAKLVTVFGGNPARGLTSHLANILLLDPQTGRLLAVMDGRYITQARTAAVSAVAAGLLARAESKVLAVIGSGVQAHSHIEALGLQLKFTEIRCWSPNQKSLLEFRAPGAEAAVRDADVVVLATSSPEPVIQSGWVKDGACVISVGACRPNQREMDPDLVQRGRLFVDSRLSALQESGDIVMGMAESRFGTEHILAELGEVVANPPLGRRNDGGVTVFKSLGLAVEDLVAANLAYLEAVGAGRGVALA